MGEPDVSLYEGSNGRYYTAWQVRRRLRSGEWTRCLRQRQPDRRLVETGDGTLLLLVSVEPDALPGGIDVRVADGRARIVDTRRTPP
ncbi:hypothetical protein [Natrinema salifodinae]|uniref:Uncharacterized protein n=1 Tax=Natrinema salifodinae TaxID=1202768 RepID=A0A1I0M1Y7_9EURY|nr:hypothetical protein [Natrinema salifodinae]SEV82168.1 hypothetical protein SAMN05216285_0314 [Natrinema salifodinae]